ncbi:gibberellin receptor GID1B-like [Hibiscus syriacus]|uniref:Gibberellin receptor GID1B-like n=1 Tax=Hibiscus syriacus TaxID=106335 RepID=A0A6A2YE40_HIBSY|nr:pentatricopeptide repeat-containing protein At2g30780-like [Hibiscus syriacus]KAE8672257.1 gibberellin receptor GID1B-like [Hibiscus syriacus]
MKRVFRIYDAAAAAKSELLFNLHRHHSKPISLISTSYNLQRPSLYRFYGDTVAPTTEISNNIINLFIEKLSLAETQFCPKSETMQKVIQLRDELVVKVGSSEEVAKILEERGDCLLGSYRNQGDVPVRTKEIPDRIFSELLKNLGSWPNLAMEVFNWRRRKIEQGYPLTPEEYASGITIAGRIKNVDLAAELFSEAESKQLKTTSTYNALMSAYMFNGIIDKCQLVFRHLKRDLSCSPSIVTYNILISVFGRLMLIDHMEATFEEVQRLNLSPNINTYNNLIAAYVTAWMWDRMESTFGLMKTALVKPNIGTHLLMLRGYAHSGNLDRMEETFRMLKLHVDVKSPLIRAMIYAYCRSSVKDRTKRVEELLRLIPEDEYKPWFNVLLIRLHAQENNLDSMEKLIYKAFEHKTAVVNAPLMRCIITAYFRCNAMDKLSSFIKRAECAGWRICRSLYHCKMCMYGLQKSLEEMENVLNEMDNVRIDYTKKTFLIMYKAYLMCGKRHKVETVVGLMCKRGYRFPMEEFLS